MTSKLSRLQYTQGTDDDVGPDGLPRSVEIDQDEAQPAIDPSRQPALWLCERALAPIVGIVGARKATGINALVTVTIPSMLWHQPVRHALARLLYRFSANLDYTSDNWKAGAARNVNDYLFDALFTKPVVIIISSDATIDPVVSACAEERMLIVPGLEVSALLAAIWPDAEKQQVSFKPFNPHALQFAVQRATGPTDCLVRLAVLDDLMTVPVEKKTAKAEISAKATKASPVVVLTPLEPVLQDLHGYGKAGEWGQSMAVDIDLYKKGQLASEDLDRGALLVGPPGTGKTMFAKALAATCEIPVIVTSYADWQSSGDGHLGSTMKSMRECFDAAKTLSPCIVFVDEIDSLPRRGTGGSDNSRYITAVVNAFLECVDGALKTEGIVTIGACNDGSGLDPAVTRSGRLDRRFDIAMPDAEALAGIFMHYVVDVGEEEIETVSTALAGMLSGADVARLVREARRIARRRGDAMTGRDILDLALPPDVRAPAIIRRTAVHEAGHAIAFIVMGHMPETMSIVSRDGTDGFVASMNRRDESRLIDLERQVLPLLCGRAAEEVILGTPSAGAYSDLEQAAKILAGVDGVFGLGGYLTPGGLDRIASEVRIRRIYAEALMLCVRHHADIVALADLAMRKRVLPKSALQTFAAERGLS